MNKQILMKLINFWFPFLGAGIKVTRISKNYREIDVEMKLRFWNRNYVGTHFGGSLFAMSDPFLMLMLINNLGKDYIVWDKAAAINFIKPGVGRVRIEFRLSAEQISDIKAKADSHYKCEPDFTVNILDDSDNVIAVVSKKLYVRRKT